MIIKDVFVKHEIGVSGAVAVSVVKNAMKCDADVEIEYLGKKANAKSFIGVLALGIPSGARINILVSGKDENIVSREIVDFI